MTATQLEIIRDLHNPKAYPWRPDQVECIETHVSWVFLAGDRVVKIKRPVDLGFVDHTTIEARYRSCEDEFRLNGRLASDVYLGTTPITRDNGRLIIDGAGEPVEWATLMRRLPAERMLDALIRADAAPEGWLDSLADRLVSFHRDAAPVCDGIPGDQAAEATGVVIDNLDELQPLMQDRPFAVELELVCAAVRTFVDQHGELLLARAREGWIREGHGDLRAEHVCLEADGAVQIFDCVEFSKALRCADVSSDLAFLLMDLDRLGVPANNLDLVLRRYRDAEVPLPPPLLGLYWIHRALVRAKVNAIRMAEADDDDDSALLGGVAEYLHNAAQHAVNCEPVIIAMTGVSGTGKSTVARLLAKVLGADLHRSDVVRKSLAGAQGSASDAWKSGIYGEAWTDATYSRLMELGEQSVARGRPVILDATFLDATRREQAADVARDLGVAFMLVETVCEDDVLVRRLEARAERRDDPSDADISILHQQQVSLAGRPAHIPDATLTASVDTTPDAYIDIDPVLMVLRDAHLITPRVKDVGTNR